MILGLDVGGTHTDAVLIEADRLLCATKTVTQPDLLATLRSALDGTLAEVAPDAIERLVFSTTMATNAIVQDELEETGMIVAAGPGMDPGWFAVGPAYHVVPGCLDHQGFEALPLDHQAVLAAGRAIRAQGIGVLGVVGKFSVRNPAHEQQIVEWLQGQFGHVALGHQASGKLDFPRRICTTYLNAALSGIHRRFTEALTRILDEKGIKAPRYVLKPDGGTTRLDASLPFPAQTAQSGPAASVMGALAMDGCPGTTLVLDVGGTTTDMAVVLDGVPLLERTGIQLGRFGTLIRSLLTKSVGIGGDSEVHLDEAGRILIGPRRRGRPAALGGPAPTPTDAMILLGRLTVGNSLGAASALAAIGGRHGWNPAVTGEQVLEATAQGIAAAAREFIAEINARPVYTIHEVLENQRIVPTSAVLIGGPVPHLAPYLEKALGLPCRVPPHHGVVNAVGAAVARVTAEITLQADTERGTVVIPEANLNQSVDAGFDLAQAIALGREVITRMAADLGAASEDLEISTVEAQSFNMIRGYSRRGRNIRLRMCLAPGLIPAWKRGV